MATKARRSQRKAKGRHSKKSQRGVRAHWLQIGAVTVGLTAAVAAGQGVALAADDGSGAASNSADSPDAVHSTSPNSHTKAPKETRKRPSRSESGTGDTTPGDTTPTASTTTTPSTSHRVGREPSGTGSADRPTHDTAATNRHTIRPRVAPQPQPQPAGDEGPEVEPTHPVGAPRALVAPAPAPADPQPEPQPVRARAVPVGAESPSTTEPEPPSTSTAVLTAAAGTVLDTELPGNAPLAASALLVFAGAVRRELDRLDEVGKTGTSTAGITTAAPPANSPPTAKLAYVAPAWFSGNVYGDVNATDANWDRLSYNATNGAKGTVKINGFGNFTYTPTAAARHAAAAVNATAADKADNFTVTVSDGRGGTATVTVTVPIKSANNNPTARVGSVSNPVEATGVVTGTVTATDKDGDPLTFSGPTTTRKGTVTVASNGTFTYTPTAAARAAAKSIFARTDSFQITVTDAHGGTGTVTVPVKITPPPANHAPSGGAVTQHNPTANGTVTGSVTATDADNDPLTYSGSITTAKGAAMVNTDGTFSYTPTAAARHAAAATNAGATGANKDTFSVTVADSKGATLTVPVNITISATNSTPGQGSFTAATPGSDGKVTGTLTTTDADNDTLTYSGTQTTARGSVVVNPGGTFTYTPTPAARHAASATGAPNTVKTDTFTATISDGHGGTSTIDVTVDVGAHNDNPEITNATVNPPGTDATVTGTVTATDADHDTLTFGGTGNTAKGSVVVNPGGSFTYTPTPQARDNAASTPGADTDTFTVSVTDGHGGADSQDVTVTVAPTTGGNHAPGNGSYTATAPGADGKVTGTVTATDADNDTLTYSGSITTAKGSVVVDTGGTFTYTPTDTARHAASATGAPDSAKTDAFTVTVTDVHGASTTVDVTVDIGAHNNGPEITNAISNAPRAGGVVTGTVKATDADNDTLTYSGSATTAKGSVVVNAGGTFTYTPTAQGRQAANGGSTVTDTFTVTITDGHGGTDSQDITVTIAPSGSVGVAGVPNGPMIVGHNGYAYQIVIDSDPDTGAATSRLIVVAPNGTSTVSQPITGAALNTGQYAPVARADGGITLFTTAYDPQAGDGVVRFVNVGANGTATTVYSGATGIPFWAGDGTAYLVTPTTKNVTVGGDTEPRNSFQVLRVGAGGAISTHTYDTGNGQYAGNPGQPAVGGDGTLYVPFTNWSDPITVPGVEGGALYAHAAVLAIPTSGAATAIPITALTGTDVDDLGNSLAAKASTDGTVYVTAFGAQASYVLAITPGGSTARAELPGSITGLQAGGSNAVVTWQETASPGATHLSFVGRQGLLSTRSWDDSQFVVGTDGTVYSLDDAEGTTLRMTTPTGSVTHVLDGSTTLTSSSYVPKSLQFASDGTPFVLVAKDDGTMHIEIPSAGVSSPSIAPGSFNQLDFRVVNDVAILVAGSDDGTRVLAIDTAGNTVAQKTFAATDGQWGAGGVTVGTDGTVYVALTNSGAGDPTTATTTAWAIADDAADPVATYHGLMAPYSGMWAAYSLTMAVVELAGDGTQFTTTTTVTTEPVGVGVGVPQSTITKDLNRATGAVSGTVTVDPGFGNGIHYGGSTVGPLGTVVVNADGSWVFTPNAAARAFAQQSGKVNSVIFGITATNSDGLEYTIPVNVSLLPTDYPATPSPQVYPLHSMKELVGLPNSVALDSRVLTWQTLHFWTVDGRDVVTNPCTWSDNCGNWDKREEKVTYASAPDLVTGPYNDIPAVPDVYLVSLLHVPGGSYTDSIVLGFRKMSFGEVTYVKQDELNPDRVDPVSGIVKQGYITYAAVGFAPGTFPDDWFYSRIPGVVGGFIYDNELPSDAMATAQTDEYDAQMQELVDANQQEHRNLEKAKKWFKILGKVAVPGTVGGVIIRGVVAAVDGTIHLITDDDEYDATYDSQQYPMFVSQGPDVQDSPPIGL